MSLLTLLLLATTAWAEPAAAPLDAETMRLLGPAPPPTAAPAQAAPSPTGDLGLVWPFMGVLAAGGILYAARQRGLPTLSPPSDLRVLGRTTLGKDTSVTVLEVRDAGGAWRRLLVGSGSQGPVLLTGLGLEQEAPLPRPVTPVAPFVPAAPVAQPPAEPIPSRTWAIDEPPAPEIDVSKALTTPPPVRRSPTDRAQLARGAPPARSYAEVAAALEQESPVARPQTSQAARPQRRAPEPEMAPEPVTSAREVLAMINRERRRRALEGL